MIDRIEQKLGIFRDRGGEFYPKKRVLEATLDAHPQRGEIVTYI